MATQATQLSTFTELGLVDARTSSGAITLPSSSQIPGRILTFKDIYGAVANSTIVITTSSPDVFEDGTSYRTLINPYDFLTVYAGSTGAWYVVGGSQYNWLRTVNQSNSGTAFINNISTNNFYALSNISTLIVNTSNLNATNITTTNILTSNNINISTTYLSTQVGLTTGSFLSNTFIQPSLFSTVVVSNTANTSLSLGETVYIANGGYYQVMNKPNAFTTTLMNLGLSLNASTSMVVQPNVAIQPSGVQTNIILPNASTNAIFSVPPVGLASTTGMLYTSGFNPGNQYRI